MASSPSEFLTFFKAASRSTALRTSISRSSTRSFASSVSRLADNEGSAAKREETSKRSDIGDADKPSRHTLEKGFDPNTHTHQSKLGRENRAQGTGGVATEQKDPGNSATKKAKEEFPEAPTTIGFQDERGGKGH